MSNDIIKFLDFEDSNIEIIDSVYRSNQRIITLQKRLFKHYCPICSHIMHSKGIYTRNAAILGTPKPLEEVLFKTGISRGPYSKKSR